MKKTAIFAFAALACVSISCKVEEPVTVDKESVAVTLTGPSDPIVLEESNQDALALTLNWVLGKPDTGGSSATVPSSSLANTLQFSASDTFGEPVEKSTPKDALSMQFTVKELNTICLSLSFEAGKAMKMYVRMKTDLGSNTEAVYSNTVSFDVTSYTSDMTTAIVLNTNKEETESVLYSAGQNGVYTGFLGVAGWYNWYLLAPDGKIWGTNNETWAHFSAAPDDKAGNFWFPGEEGCYFTTVNTSDAAPFWTALYIPQVNISGDITGVMEFSKSLCAWTYTFENESSSTLNITLSAEGHLYDTTTGDSAYNTKAVGFGGTADDITFGDAASAVSVSVETGTVTLILDLKDPSHWTLSQGEDVPQGPAKYLYIMGNDDKYDFTEYLTLYDEEKLAYAALAYMNSSWGWYFCQEKDNWEKTGYESDGHLVVGGSEIPGPGVGLYLVEASLKEMTYSTVECENKAWVTGFNDVWDLNPMTETDVPGVFTSTVTVTSGSTPWGFKVFLDDSWGKCFGCTADGSLLYSKDGKALDASYDGTYTLTVDLCHCTWTMTK